MMRRMFAVIFGVLILLPKPSAAQCDITIPDAVERSRPGPLILSRVSEMVVAPLDQAIAEADLIAVGTLKRQSVYLSPDKCALYTDWAVEPSRIVKWRAAMPQNRPGPPVIIVARSWGGETTISAVLVKQSDANSWALTDNQRYLLFLRYNPSLGRYEVCDHGAYALQLGPDDRLRPVLKDEGLMDPAIAAVDVETAIRVLQQRMQP